MAKNYTPIPGDKRPANAATFNNPLDQLDTKVGDVATLLNNTATSVVATIGTPLPTTTAQTIVGAINEHDTEIGNLATLNTTPKTSLVGILSTATPGTTAQTVIGAINELDTQIGAAASASGTIGTSIDTDGTLKAGAVDGTTILADGIVSDAKMVQVDKSQLAPDPFLIFGTSPNAAYGDGRVRWYAAAAWQFVSDDAGNPYSGFGGRTCRITSGIGGRRFYMDECGLAVGEVVSLGVLVYLPATRTAVRIAVTYFKANGDTISSASGATTAGADATVLKTVLNQTIPAETYAFDLYFNLITGTGNIDSYAWYIQRGATLSTSITAPRSRNDTTIALRRLEIMDRSPLAVGPDPHGIFAMGPGETMGDGRTRWYLGAAWGPVASDAANPFVGLGGRTCRTVGTGVGGRYYYLDECGLNPLDVISTGLYALIPATKTAVRIGVTCYDAADTNLGSFNGVTVAGADAPALLLCENVKLPATTAYFALFINLSTGTGSIDIYAWRVVKAGAFPPAMIGTPTIANGQTALTVLRVAAGAYANLPARLTAIEAGVPSPYPATSLGYGVHLLHDWQAQIAKILSADTTSQAVVALLGDSWTNTDYRLGLPLRTLAQTQYGSAGVGWVSATDAGTVAVPTGVTKTQAGTWTNRDHTTTPRGRGIDLCEALSTDDSAPVGSVAITATFTDAAIHYLKQVDGATFRWQTDSDGWNAVDSAAGADAYTVIAITGKSNASHTLTIEVVDASSAGHTAGLVLFGVDCKIAGNGVRVSKLGVSGATAAQWATRPDTTLWAAGLTALAPNLVIICLGTNDDSGDVVPATFRTSIETLATAVRAALPSCDILYLSPAANGLSVGTYGMADYVNVLRASALANSYAMFDAYLLLPDYTTADARGLYDNTSHINALGGRVIIGRLYRDLLAL